MMFDCSGRRESEEAFDVKAKLTDFASKVWPLSE